MVRRLIKKIVNKLLPVKKKVDVPGLAEFLAAAEKSDQRFLLQESDYYPCFDDNTENTGFDRHYVYHPAWAVRILKQINPEFHIDISSILYFSAMLSAFVPVKFYDYRPANISLDNLSAGAQDLTNLSFADGSVHSLSCMHTVEHVGLGRYGDPIDYDGDLKAMHELTRVLAPGGNLLFVTPIGAAARIQFNAHRIYTKQSIVDVFLSKGLLLKEFTLIPEAEDDRGLVIDPAQDLLDRQTYACGCFWFVKK